jgi:hypothetical protein
MNKKAQIGLIGRFAVFIFIFIIFLMFVPMIWETAGILKPDCDISYTFLCFVNDATLPLIGIVFLFLGIKYFKGEL